MKHKNYLMAFHGLDIGLVYNLPKNVRVFMYCFSGKEVDAADWNEAATWYTATLDEKKYDKEGKFMEKLTLTLDSSKPNSKCAQYCVFSGNLSKHDMNRIPDLFLEDEQYNFKTGLYNLPARFQRIFLKDKYSSVDNKYYKPGDKSKIDVKTFNTKIKPFIKKNKDLPDDGFLTYFVNPGSLNQKINKLDFVVVPDPKYFNSYIDLERKTKKLRKLTDSFRIPRRKSDKHFLENYQWDISIPNTSDNKDIKKINRIKKSTPGVYLSDVIRYLCLKNPDKFITIIVSSCRSFHYNIPKNVIKNQQKTSTVSTSEYIKKYAKIDIN